MLPTVGCTHTCFSFGSAPQNICSKELLLDASNKMKTSIHRYTNRFHSTKQTLSVSIRECGRPSEEFCSLWTAEKREIDRVGREEGWGCRGEENQRQIGNGKDGRGKCSGEDTLHNLCSLFCLSPYSLSD